MAVAKDPKRTVKARKLDKFVFDAQPGDCFQEPDDGNDRLSFACPGCGVWGGVRAGSPKPEHKPSWEIVAGKLSDPENLILSPSIHCVGCCGWHGFLGGSDRKQPGVFVSC